MARKIAHCLSQPNPMLPKLKQLINKRVEKMVVLVQAWFLGARDDTNKEDVLYSISKV